MRNSGGNKKFSISVWKRLAYLLLRCKINMPLVLLNDRGTKS